MHAVDTNVVVRYLTNDDPAQAHRARSLIDRALIDHAPVWIGLCVMLETEWVLRSAYRVSPRAIMASFRSLAGHPNVTAEQPHLLARAIDLCERGMDFADALHISAMPAGATFHTFDADVVRRAGTLALVGVVAL